MSAPQPPVFTSTGHKVRFVLLALGVVGIPVVGVLILALAVGL